ncbi:class I SAM-dependent methyltransferase [Marinibactrum halimedae]|uniref:Methyltransferase n=1 Tax=Marinibactrum halimedae TaxID=1444977 RepID=A0AA37T5Q7_9GAMM|nr:class I SAM-dependent methyltransferase [Marinibactrum halimedae]MCD9459326.1 class I SAM-dependent methyltransferase [Marinibactrum halimedae]GLS25783.1 methyltransferase [Marinibactrum halimedae]
MQTIDFSHLDCQPGHTVLDLGCGEGRHTIGAYLLHESIDVIGVDLSHKDLCTAAEKFEPFDQRQREQRSVSWSVADGLKLPFADNTFDRVVCSEVLEHIPDYQGMLAEIDRVLKPEGLLAISVPRAWPEKICWKLSDAYYQVPGGHVRIFNSQALQNDIESYGFLRYRKHWAHALHSPFWWLKCWFWDKPEHALVRWYHKLLVWDLMSRPWITTSLEKCLNPIMGKSVVFYFAREPINTQSVATVEDTTTP